jgi:DNA-binding PadR family transcriptional regulator
MTPVFRHGRLRLYLLRLLDEEPRHGYEVIRLLRDRFMGIYAPSPGTIYPRLARLEEEGLVTHDEENGRKVYRITEAGREELRNRGDELDELEEELSASVSDIVREVREDVRDTVRSLREELTRAAREMRGYERDAREQAREQGRAARDEAREAAEATREQGRAARDSGREAAEAAKEQARQVRDQARDQARGQRDQTRDQARQARDEAFAHAHRLREEATRLRDEAREQWNSGWGNWNEWGHWGEWAGRSGWPGQHDLGALRDFERLARDFVADLRGAARESGSLFGSDVIPTLRDILADTLERIRSEVFEPHHEASGTAGSSVSTAGTGSPGGESAKDTPPE